VHHAILGLLAVELDLQQLLVDRVATRFSDASDRSPRPWRQQDLVVVQQAVLEDMTPDISSGDVVSDFEGGRFEVPFLLTIEGRDGNAAGDVDALGFGGNGFEGSLDTIVDSLQ
jgi:hypothetical protein